MSRLAGKFAGIVLVTVADNRFDAVAADLRTLSTQGLQITLERTDEPVERDRQRLHLELLGDNHPGIVAEISALLASHLVSIEELTTNVREAPWQGECSSRPAPCSTHRRQRARTRFDRCSRDSPTS